MTAVARIDYFHTADKKTDIKEHEVYAIYAMLRKL